MKRKTPRGRLILEDMPRRAKSLAVKKICTIHNIEHKDGACQECRKEYKRKYYRDRKDPFA